MTEGNTGEYSGHYTLGGLKNRVDSYTAGLKTISDSVVRQIIKNYLSQVGKEDRDSENRREQAYLARVEGFKG